MLMQNVVRLSDRFLDRTNPESIDRQERLRSCVALVSIFYLTLSIGFCKFSELEKRHRVYHPDPNVAFELMIAPKEHSVPVDILPPQTALTDGSANVGGKKNAAPTDTTQNMAAVKVDDQPKKDESVVLTHRLPVDKGAPVAVTSTNQIKSIPVSTTDDTTKGLVQDEGNTGKERKGDGVGIDGVGPGTAIGGGTDIEDAGGKRISTTVEEHVAKGNIAPYRKDLLIRIAQFWRPKKKDVVVVQIRIAKDGTLLAAQVAGASSDRAAKTALAAVNETPFAPLPIWYRGEDLDFQITLDAATILQPVGE